MDELIKVREITEFTLGGSVLEITYIISSILFIIGLKMLSHPDTARRGNIWAAVGMALAIFSTIVFHQQDGQHIGNVGWILGAIALGTISGTLIAKRVKMTAMPQLVSFFNGMGGAAAALISLMEFPHVSETLVARYGLLNGQVLVILLALMIGSVSFAGSMIAYGKLDGKIGDIRSGVMRIVNITLLLLVLGFIAYIMSLGQVDPAKVMHLVYILFALSLVYGVFFVMPIGGADMPVVISLLNSFTGIAAAMGGFLYDNQVMLTGGILVGSAGTILTVLMCKAMNRSLTNVIVGAFGGGTAAETDHDGQIREIGLSDAAVLLNYSPRVLIVPGYGLAVAQAQMLTRELDKLLVNNGVDVKYAIHPVAGRMPGHMNVLLAEADIPYDKLLESEGANEQMEDVDVAVVVGANDVVNPAAEEDPSSPIAGMPILQVYKAKNIIVMKRGMGKGYAGIENKLFYNDKTRMLFGNAKESIQEIVNEIKNM
jgi:NAD(P) transhydrogenase subunit beta